ncbi:MAG: efflux RND transporter periplasmic adaptor subunit [bacterium]
MTNRCLNVEFSHRPRNLRSLALWISILLLLALVGAGCGGDAAENSGEADSTAAAEADTSGSESKPEKTEKAIKVDVAAVRQGELVMPIYADGAIRTPSSVVIRTKIGGELVQVLVKDGDRVHAGQLLAQFDPREYALALEEARYAHFRALSQVAAEADTFSVNDSALSSFVERRRALDELLRNRTLSREEYQAQLLELELEALNQGAFRQTVFEQRTGLADARVAEERAKLNLENTEIRAPFPGMVQGLSVVQGEILSVNSPICTIYDNRQLEAVVNVLEADLGNLVRGRPALVAIPATGDTLQTEVDVISPQLDETSRTCQVIIRFDNPDDRYRPGMFVRAEIAGWIYTDKLQVPKAAVLSRDNRTLVFKVNGERAQWLYVDIGLKNDSWVEILKVHSGGSLAPGEQVVVSDHLTLAHEAKIDIRKTLPPTDRWDFAVASAGSSQ